MRKGAPGGKRGSRSERKKKCVVCGKSFLVTRRNQIVCSEPKDRHHRGRGLSECQYKRVLERGRKRRRGEYWTPKRKAVRKAYMYWRSYGISLEDYADMCKDVGGRCPICQEKRRLVVDHDHGSGVVRGVICSTCNRGLGLIGDGEDGLKRALRYLRGGGR